MAHELRIAKPAVGHDHWWGQLDAAPTKSRYTPVHHDLHPAQFITTRRSRACGVGTPDSKVHGHHQFAIADHHDEQDAINPGEYPVFLPTPPSAHQA
jgi:hypothetical protein